MNRTLAAALLATTLTATLAACSDPVFVPEAGPGAPGYRELGPPPAPQVTLARTARRVPAATGGSIDSIVRHDDTVDLHGWVPADLRSRRTRLHLVLPDGVDAQVRDTETLARPDVVGVTGNDDLLWAGFKITLDGSLPDDAGVCLILRSPAETIRLTGSDETLCAKAAGPAPEGER